MFTCSTDADCTGNGAGSCQPDGFCAFPDAMCESGQRYGELAGGGFANACVPIDEGTTGVDTASSGPTTGVSTSPLMASGSKFTSLPCRACGRRRASCR